MRSLAAAALITLILAGCRTAAPAGEETGVAPLTSASADGAAQQLAARRMQLTTERALMRIRATNDGHTQSFRAQLIVDGRGRMLLTAYTPLGTSAMELYAAGDEITFVNDLEGTWWRGSAADFARSFGFFGSVAPANMALLIAGLPVEGNGIVYQYAPAGLARAMAGDAVVTFEPPSYPPQHVTIARGAQRLEIEYLETAMTTASVEPPEIPADYRCCVAPKL